MPRPSSKTPTEVELQILNVLWEQGPSPVRQIHKALSQIKETNYSTTVKMLGVMLEKSLVTRDESAKPHVYRAAATRKQSQNKILKGLITRVYKGSSASLVMQALATNKASKEELAEIRALLDQLEGDQK